MGLLTLGAIVIGGIFAAQQDIKTETVFYNEGETQCEGFVAHKAGIKKAPVVLIVHDWNGQDDYERGRAKQIAELGYIGFAIDVYGRGVRPTNAQESGKQAMTYYADNALFRRRLTAAYEQAKKLPGADPNRIAVMGYCFGGSGSLELARSGANLVGAVSFHGGLSTSNPAKPGVVKCPILVLHGAADPVVPKAQVDAFAKEMNDAKVKWSMVSYPGAVHAFTVPGPNYQEEADKKSWEEMRKFFLKVFHK